MTFDTIIVGGGSAGSILANRLSARSRHRVLLCEAGQDTPPGRVPEIILDSNAGRAYLEPSLTWSGLRVTLEATSHNDPGGARPAPRRYEQARVLGGGSSINGQLANRGAPTDYDEWEAKGARGWNWANCLPYFKKVERDLDFEGEWHGATGRIPVSRIFQDRWSGHAHAVAAAFAAAGYEYLPDQNGEFRDGHFPITISNAYDRRVTAAMGYLDAGTRLRANLTILTDTTVTGLMFEDLRCVGVRALVKGVPQEFRAGEVILSSGAIHSPAHLLRAGIGPAGHLRELGIPVLAALPGVGQRLMEHPTVSVSSYLRPEARALPHNRRNSMVAMRYSSLIEGAPAGDMFIMATGKTFWHPVGERLGALLVSVYKTYSETGQVRLASPHWRDEPVVEFNLLSDHRDVLRMMDGVRRLAALHEMPSLKAVALDPFPTSYSDRVRRVADVNRRNYLVTSLLAKILDGPDAIRRAALRRLVMEGPDLPSLLADDEALERFVRAGAHGIWHASCTCRMGSDGDPMAVTDPAGRVRKVTGLRVCDASVFPAVPSANTNFPVYMTAEKIADAIIAGE